MPVFEQREQELEKVYEDGEVVFSQGDDSREMFIVQEGRVDITMRVRKREVHLTTLEKGDFFGEMALLELLPRSATATARGKTKCLVMLSGGFLLRLRRDPTLAFEMLKEMSSRIRRLSSQLSVALGSDEERLTLLSKIEYNRNAGGEPE
jgi:CRP-like cAMP-binding protein